MTNIPHIPDTHFLPLDTEEAELMRAHEAGEYVRSPDSDVRVAELNAMLSDMRKTRNKKTLISLRSNTASLEVIKQFAKQQNIPYQTFLNHHIDKIADDIRLLTTK